MNIVLPRFYFGNTRTIGRIFIDGEFFCYSLEDKVREIPYLEVEKWKVPKETAIPFGLYTVILDYSTRFKTLMPHILGVDGFTGIRIHGGNTEADIEGCIAVGMNFNRVEYKISNCAPALDGIIRKLTTAAHDGEKTTIKITREA